MHLKARPVESLVGRRAVQSALFFVVVTSFEVIQHTKEVFKGRHVVFSAVKAGLEALFLDDLLRFSLFHGISALTHEADTGDQAFILFNQPFKVWKKRFPHVLLQIL